MVFFIFGCDNSAIANPICEFNDATSGINTTASTETTIDLNTTNDAQTGVISTSKSTSCTAVDNAGNQATITVNYIVETTPLSPTTVLYETTFDNLNNWTSCARGSATLTDLESKSVLHLEGRKGAGTACRRQMIVVTESAPSYSFSCEAKKNAGGYAELEIYFSGERPANGARLVTPVVSDSFATYTVNLENPTNQIKNIYISLLAKRQSGVDANLYVDSCQLIANN